MRTSLPIVWAAAALLLTTDGLGAQEERLGDRMNPESSAAVLALADSARVLALPTEPVILKALEGASKGADTEAIVAAVRALIHDMDRARDALGPDLSEDVLVLAAAALDQGAAPEELARLREGRGAPSFGSALGGLVYLLGRRVPAEASVAVVGEMLEAGLPGAAFVSLQRLVERDMQAGAAPTESARVRARAMIRAGGPLGPGGGRE